MKTLSAIPALCEENRRSLVDSPHKGLVIRSFDIVFDVGMDKLMNKKPVSG